MVLISFQDILPVDINKTFFYEKWIEEVVIHEGFQLGDISIILCSDEYLLTINKEYLSHDYYTDIITFDYTENNVISGDLFISGDRVEENAKEYNISFLHELNRVIIHGVLHLCGYKDKTIGEKQEMRNKEDEMLSFIESV